MSRKTNDYAAAKSLDELLEIIEDHEAAWAEADARGDHMLADDMRDTDLCAMELARNHPADEVIYYGGTAPIWPEALPYPTAYDAHRVLIETDSGWEIEDRDDVIFPLNGWDIDDRRDEFHAVLSSASDSVFMTIWCDDGRPGERAWHWCVEVGELGNETIGCGDAETCAQNAADAAAAAAAAWMLEVATPAQVIDFVRREIVRGDDDRLVQAELAAALGVAQPSAREWMHGGEMSRAVRAHVLRIAGVVRGFERNWIVR